MSEHKPAPSSVSPVSPVSADELDRQLAHIKRGCAELINEDDLVRILEEKKIYGAGLDVFQHEPASESPLLNFKNVVVGSHCAASTEGAVENMSNFAVDNLIEAFKKRGLL